MAAKTVSQITPIINENGLKVIEYEGQILFASEDVGHQLGYRNPAKSINILFNRNQKELSGYAVGIKVMSTDGKRYEVRHFTEEGVYILSMLANTPQARDFRASVAALLRRLRQERTETARLQGLSQGYQKGLSEAGKEIRALETANKTAYLDGLNEGQRLQRRQDGLAVTERALGYMRRGLSLNEASKLCDCNRETLRLRLRRLRAALTATARPTQATLPGVSHDHA